MSNHALPGFGRYIVTVKLPRNPDHDPHDKKTERCPAAPSPECTDATGEHHSFLVETDRLDEVLAEHRHVTRVERVVKIRTHMADDGARNVVSNLSGHELLLRQDLERAALDAYSLVPVKTIGDHEKATRAAVAAALLRMSEEQQRMSDGERCCGPAPEPQCLRCGAPDEVAGWLRVTALRLDPEIESRGDDL